MTDRAGDFRARTDAKTDKFKKATRESEKVWAQYEADGRALRARTERLRSLRLAKEAADIEAAPPPVTVRKARKKPLSAKALVGGKAAMATDPPRDH